MMRLEIAVTLVMVFSAAVLAQTAVAGFEVFPVGVFAAAEDGSVVSDLPDWAKGVSIITASIAGPVFGLWYAWYVTVVRLPAIEKAHSDRADKMLENFRSDVREYHNSRHEDNNRLAEILQRLHDDSKCQYKEPRPG